jgi:hypothetical protein
MASRSQISKLAARIEGLADANAPRQASVSVINIPHGMDKERVLAKHRQRWPVNGNGRSPVLVVWVSIGAPAAHTADGDHAQLSRYCDDISWREVAREELARVHPHRRDNA